VLDRLFQKRHELAYAIGLIEEVPIAMCNSDYDFNQGLKIETRDDSQSIPHVVVQAKEINLFFVFRVELPSYQKEKSVM